MVDAIGGADSPGWVAVGAMVVGCGDCGSMPAGVVAPSAFFLSSSCYSPSYLLLPSGPLPPQLLRAAAA